jgi:tol-pal system protein YbgF
MVIPMKNFLVKSLVLCLCIFTLFSCSSLNLFKKGDPAAEQALIESNTAQKTDNTEILKKQLESKIRNISVLEEEVSSLEKKVSGLEKQLAAQKPVIYKIAYTEPSQLYQKARGLLLEGDLINAAQLFETFIAQHPNHSLADNAMYWLGECHYSSGQYKKAIGVFKELIKAYPKAEKVPDALLKTGYAYLSLDDVNRAHHYLKSVLTKYPFSPAAEKAQEKLKEFE